VRILPRSFYARPTVDVAWDLLGKFVRHRDGPDGEALARIVETEAYLGTGDEAAHAARGVTPRTKILFGPPGHAYVYLIYGMHYCLNISAETEGTAGCVLIRAVEPVIGITRSTNGPGKLTKAMGITLKQNGVDVTRGSITVLEDEGSYEPVPISVSKRVGITKSASLPLRFYIRGNRFVSHQS
jgi:DNA-3-methyladenine glycosylase